MFTWESNDSRIGMSRFTIQIGFLGWKIYMISNKLIILKDHYENLQGNLYKTRSLQVISLFRDPWKLAFPTSPRFSQVMCVNWEIISYCAPPWNHTFYHHFLGCLVPPLLLVKSPMFDGGPMVDMVKLPWDGWLSSIPSLQRIYIIYL